MVWVLVGVRRRVAVDAGHGLDTLLSLECLVSNGKRALLGDIGLGGSATGGIRAQMRK